MDGYPVGEKRPVFPIDAAVMRESENRAAFVDEQLDASVEKGALSPVVIPGIMPRQVMGGTESPADVVAGIKGRYAGELVVYEVDTDEAIVQDAGGGGAVMAAAANPRRGSHAVIP